MNEPITSDGAGPTGQAGAGSPSVADAAPRRRAPRLRTVVLGLLLAVIGVSALVSESGRGDPDLGGLIIADLMITGLVLLGGALVARARPGDDGR